MNDVSAIFNLLAKDRASSAFLRVADPAPFPGRCRWLTRWENAAMPCRERAIPGGALCAEHLIDNERTKP